MAERSYVVAVDPQNGFAPDAKIDMAGFRNVLKRIGTSTLRLFDRRA
jgi:hypothetical protein